MNAFAARNPAQLYARNERASVTGRVAEGRAFAKAAMQLDAVANGTADAAARSYALTYNRILWTALQADLSQPGSKLPTALRAKLLSLSLYVDRALLQLRVTRKRAPLDALIDINRNIAQGLLATSGEA
jgi:flagellar protein FlaF